MKLSPVFSFKAIASLAVVAFWTLSLNAQNATPRTVHVSGLAGTVSHSHAGGQFVPLASGAKLGKGDVIKTGPGSHVDLDMGRNVGMVQVAPNSTFSIDEVTATSTGTDMLTDTQVSLSAGTMYAKVNKLAKGSRYEITTPKGIAGIRGSALSMTAAGQLTMGEGEGGIAFGPTDVEIVHEKETAGPSDRPSHPASAQALREIVDALRDAATHGAGPEIRAFWSADQEDGFISPTTGAKAPTSPSQGE